MPHANPSSVLASLAIEGRRVLASHDEVAHTRSVAIKDLADDSPSTVFCSDVHMSNAAGEDREPQSSRRIAFDPTNAGRFRSFRDFVRGLLMLVVVGGTSLAMWGAVVYAAVAMFGLLRAK
jgi:hypothetical protein